MLRIRSYLFPCAIALLVTEGGCFGDEPTGLAPAPAASTTVVMDFYHKPLPEIPLPNDIATRYDATSATGRRINASMVAPTRFESHIRELINRIDGWGVSQPIAIPFSGPLDISSILEAHRDDNYDLSDDVVYLINIDRSSKEFGKPTYLDMGNGNYPVILESLDRYGKNDPRDWTLSLLFDEEDEDKNGNNKLDPGEDTDADGVLDKPNYLPREYLPGKAYPTRDDLAGRADALMTFYERETNTLILRPMTPLRERTRYAVVVTRRLKDAGGRPVGSPYAYVNHTAQTRALEPLVEVLPPGLELEDVAFTFSYTTQSIQAPMTLVRDGLYGHGIQAHLGQNFPAEIARLEPLRDAKAFPTMKNPYILHPEFFVDAVKDNAAAILGGGEDVGEALVDFTVSCQQYVDYFAMGSFDSPQLFQRKDAQGNFLPLNDQTWPADLDRTVATARKESIPFWLVVPRKEVSVRGQGKPAPVVIIGHSYLSNRLEILPFGCMVAAYGYASIVIEAPAHGLGIGKVEAMLVRALLEANGLGAFFDALTKDRAFDHNGDGVKDPGADFWTSYMFHTRDNVRQSVLDHMQLVRVLRNMDGKRRWALDVNGDGKPELAGDFDGDGQVDIDGKAPFTFVGGSLGGITSLMMGALEPAVKTIVPIAGGAGYGAIGIRSNNPGVPEALMLRLFGPIYTGTIAGGSNTMQLETTVPDMNVERSLPIATVGGVRPGDTMVVENLDNKELGCGIVSDKGLVRAAVASDVADRTQIKFYRGHVITGKDCQMASNARLITTVSTFEEDVVFQGKTYAAGSPLVALAEGHGLPRATPDFRRAFLGFGPLVTDPGDPVAYARNIQLEPYTYPGTNERTGAHVLLVTGVGDMAVPASSGVTAGRAIGIIDFLKDDPRYGKPVNQVLIDTYTMEAVHTLKRFTNPKGEGVHKDVDNLSQGQDVWGKDVPRLEPPLRIGVNRKDPVGGLSAALFPYSDAQGFHAFFLPGMMTDMTRDRCKKECPTTTGDDPCGCDKLYPFDVGVFMFNVIGRYILSGSKKLDFDLCRGRIDCPSNIPLPKLRDKSTLDH